MDGLACQSSQTEVQNLRYSIFKNEEIIYISLIPLFYWSVSSRVEILAAGELDSVPIRPDYFFFYSILHHFLNPARNPDLKSWLPDLGNPIRAKDLGSRI